MLFGVITGPTMKEALEQLEVALSWTDGVEWRLDLFSSLDFDEVSRAVRAWPKRTMLTFRGASREITKKWLEIGPDFFDIDEREPWAKEVIGAFPNIRFVLSHHDFEKTPEDLDDLLAKMRKTPAFTYKIAAKANSTLDALKMLNFVQNNSGVIGISMGADGQATRILGPVVGNLIDYASLGNADPSLGQLEVADLCATYRYLKLKKGEPLYALLGDPVSFSISHKTHNRCFETLQEGVYLKLRVTPTELATFRELASTLPFRGFSVTMPLKLAIREILDEKPEGAINTVHIVDGCWVGHNTDGEAAAALIEEKMSLQGKRCLIVGAGGAAQAIAVACKKRGATIAVANRTMESARRVAVGVEGEFFALEAAPQDYDVLIQATSVGMSPDEAKMPISEESILSSALVFETISSPLMTRLLSVAQDRGCQTINGRELFFKQAAAQFRIWTGRAVLFSEFQM